MIKNENKKTNLRSIEAIGWLGLVISIIVYILLSFGVIAGRSIEYQVLYFISCLALSVISIYKKAYQPAILNGLLCIISIVTIVSIIVSK